MDNDLIQMIGAAKGNVELLGAKGHHLSEMSKKGLPVPPGFILTTKAYHEYQRYLRTSGEPDMRLKKMIEPAVTRLEEITDEGFGNPEKPLFVSVRSGASVSMPGMMDTILNVGLTDKTVDHLAHSRDFARRAYKMLHEKIAEMVGMEEDEEIKIKDLAYTKPFPDELLFFREMFGDQIGALYNRLLAKKRHIKNDKKVFDLIFNDFIDSNLNIPCVCSTCYISMIQTSKTIGKEGIDCFNRYSQKNGRLVGIDNDGIRTRLQMEDGSYGDIQLDDRESLPRLNFRPGLIAALQKGLKLAGFGNSLTDRYRELVIGTYQYYVNQDYGISKDPLEHLTMAIGRIFESWESERAMEYRRIHNISDSLGTAVVVQRMVYGNLNSKSGTAVVFTSNPTTGERKLSGAYLRNALGEDLVSGRKTPTPIEDLKEEHPKIYGEIEKKAKTLERICHTPQDLELTWEGDKLYVLQRRDAKLTDLGNIAFLLRRYEDGEISAKELIKSISLKDVYAIMNRSLIKNPDKEILLGTGSAILPRIVTGQIAIQGSDKNSLDEDSIYITNELDPSDVPIIAMVKGLVSKKGSCYSHAGIVSTNMGKVFATGFPDLEISEDHVTFGNKVVRVGEWMTIDGATGKLYAGQVETACGSCNETLDIIVSMAKNLVKGLSKIIKYQCRDDLAKYRSQPGQKILYEMDFDLAEILDSEGLAELSGVGSTKASYFERRLKSSARALVQTIYKETRASNHVVLTFGNTYDNYMIGLGFNPDNLKPIFLKEYAAAAKARERTRHFSILAPEKDWADWGYSINIDGLKKARMKQGEISNGQNCVIMHPWAPELSYFAAAQKREGGQNGNPY